MKFQNILWIKNGLDEVSGRVRELVSKAASHSVLSTAAQEAVAAQGKMLRPAALLMAAGKTEGAVREELISFGAALEVTHCASLLHDDVIDDAPLRRNLPTVQSRYGKSTAIYAGDYLLAASNRCLAEKEYARDIYELTLCIENMCDGEVLQLENRGNVAVREEEYYEAIVGKTAYTFSMACRMGGVIGGQSEETARKLGELGLKVGVMFQLRDDLLDWTSTEEESGKPVNNDFYEGIYTLPAIHTFAGDRGDELRALAAKGTLTKEELALARSIVTQAGGVDCCRERIKKYAAEAKKLIASFPKEHSIRLLEEAVETLENV